MIKRILVPTDGSDVSMQGARYAVGLAKRLDADILGLFVVDIRLLEGPFLRDLSASLGTAPYVNYQNNIQAMLEDRGKIALDLLKKQCESAGIACETEQTTGIIHRCILEKSSLADMVVMGRSGEHSAWLDGLIGSTTDAVLRRATLPVVVSAEEEPRSGHYVLAFDGSPQSSHALKSGTSLCHALGAALHVLSVGKPEKCAEKRKMAQDYLESHDLSVEYVARSGDPAEEILGYARETNAAMIVMGAYGHTRVRELILGSTTAQVLNHAPCPVLLQK